MDSNVKKFRNIFTLFYPKLHVVELRIDSVLPEELFVVSALYDAVFGKHQDLFRIADGGETVGDHECGASRRQLFQRFLHDPLALVVQRDRKSVV